MNRTSQLREQIDACRSGSDDLSLPELAGLAQSAETDRAVADELSRSQRFDRAVGACLHDVPVPAGLLERLLAATQSGASADASPALNPAQLNPAQLNPAPAANDQAVGVPSEPIATRTPSRRTQFSRRTLLAAVGSVAALVLVGISLAIYGTSQPNTVSQAQLQAELSSWMLEAEGTQPGWTATSVKAAPPEFPIPEAVRLRPVRWRATRTAAGPTVVYDFDHEGQGRATLFVVATPAQYSVAPLPRTLLTGMTGGRSVGAWQSKHLLYVFVVHGSEQDLDRLLKKPNQA